MQPIEKKHRESGVTLVELTISLTIITLIVAGGYQMLMRSQKYAAQKKVTVSTQTEVDQLLGIIKKDWEYRANRVLGAGASVTGHRKLTSLNTPCLESAPPALPILCPKLRLWLERNINNTKIPDVVTIENVCRRPTDKAMQKLVATLNPNAKMEAACGSCPSGEIPAVKIEGLNMNTNQAVLASENRLFPQNATDLDRVKADGVLGMQACFSQESNTGAISVYVRAVYRDQSENSLNRVSKTQIFPFENFARIRLEQ